MSRVSSGTLTAEVGSYEVAVSLVPDVSFLHVKKATSGLEKQLHLCSVYLEVSKHTGINVKLFTLHRSVSVGYCCCQVRASSAHCDGKRANSTKVSTLVESDL